MRIDEHLFLSPSLVHNLISWVILCANIKLPFIQVAMFASPYVSNHRGL